MTVSRTFSLPFPLTLSVGSVSAQNGAPPRVPGMVTLAGQKDPSGAAARVLALETTLAGQQGDRARNRERNATYNKTALSALQASMPNFDWSAYFSQVLPAATAAGLTDVIVRQPDYLTSIDAALASTPVNTWKEYLVLGLSSERVKIW